MTLVLLALLSLAAASLVVHATPTQDEHYEVITPIFLATDEVGAITIQLSDYILSLKHQKLPARFTNTYYRDSRAVVENDFAGCVYGGTVDGFSEWSVSLTLCNGIHGHFGDVIDRENYYQIEPLDPDATNYSINQPHLFYSESSRQSSNESLGICLTSAFMQAQGGKYFDVFSGRRPEPMASQGFEENQRIVELVLVNDHYQYLRFDRQLSSVVLRDIEIVDYMNLLYTELNISIALVGVVTWTEGDLIAIPEDLDPVRLLVNFKNYFNRIPGHLDCAMLISGRDFKESVVGLAYKGAICYGKYSVGIVQDARVSVRAVGGTATHEMGHILNMSHDNVDGRVCECADPTGKCIMAAIAPSVPSTAWSNCSIHDLEQYFIMSPYTARCLFNEPTQLYNSTPSTAGNSGISQSCITSAVLTLWLTIIATLLLLQIVVI